MYSVYLSLNSQKHWTDQTPPVLLDRVETEGQAQALMRWVERDLKSHSLYVDEVRCADNLGQGWQNSLAIHERKAKYPKPDAGGGVFAPSAEEFDSYMADELEYIGCLFYLEDRA